MEFVVFFAPLFIMIFVGIMLWSYHESLKEIAAQLKEQNEILKQNKREDKA
jgi:cbb3-type cytochrome oxidase subunit 3